MSNGLQPPKQPEGDGWDLKSICGKNTIMVSDVLIYYNGTFYTWLQATSNENEEGTPLILPFLYGWNYSNQVYEVISTIEPHKGFWAWLYFYPIEFYSPFELQEATATKYILALPNINTIC